MNFCHDVATTIPNTGKMACMHGHGTDSACCRRTLYLHHLHTASVRLRTVSVRIGTTSTMEIVPCPCVRAIFPVKINNNDTVFINKSLSRVLLPAHVLCQDASNLLLLTDNYCICETAYRASIFYDYDSVIPPLHVITLKCLS